jgi:hypothetical protein
MSLYTAQIERKVQKLVCKHRSALPTDLKQMLAPYHSKPLHLYGFPKLHKPDVPLRSIVSSIGSPCYALPGFLQKTFSPLLGNDDSFFRNSDHLIQSVKWTQIKSCGSLVNFDVVSLFTSV